MNTMTDVELTFSALSAFLAGPVVRVGAASSLIPQDSAFGMGAYAANGVIDGRVLPCAPVVTKKRTEAGVAAVSPTNESFSSKRCLATHAMRATHAINAANPVVTAWPLRPSGICGAPPG